MSVLTETPTVEFCEKAGTGIVARPFYALSNLGFFVTALLVLKKSGNRLARLFALTSFIIGLFSLIYDSYPRRITQLFDISGMYIFVGLLLTVNLARLLKKSICNSFLYLLPILVLGFIVAFLLGGSSGNIIYGAFILAYVGLEIRLLYQKPERFNVWLRALIIFGAGFSIWCLDFFNIYCMPQNYLNGRGVFHLTSAIAIYFLYDYYALNQARLGLK